MPGVGLGLGLSACRKRPATAAPVSVISAVLPPVSSELFVGDALEDTPNWSSFLSAANYASTSGPISSVVVNYIGDTATATQAFADGALNAFSITVTDSAGGERTFAVQSRVVLYLPPVPAAALPDPSFVQNTGDQTLDASAGFTGDNLTYSVNAVPGVSLDSTTGVIRFDTDIMGVQTDTGLVVTASNSGGVASVGLSVTISAPAVSVVGPVADQSFGLGTGDISIDLAGVFANATTYSATGTGASVAGSVLTLSDDTVLTDESITVTGSNSSGSAQDQFTLTVTAPVVTVTNPIADQSITQNEGAVTLDLETVFANATAYSVTGTGASVTGSVLTISDTTALSGVTITVTGSNAFNSADDIFVLDVVAAAAAISVENDGDEPVITAPSGNTDPFIYTVGTGPQAGTYTQSVPSSLGGATPLTVALIEAGSQPITNPAPTGNTGVGDTLSCLPPLFLYAGSDPGDTTYQWQSDGVDIPGATGATFDITVSEEGTDVRRISTFDGVVVTSPVISLSGSAGQFSGPGALGAKTLSWFDMTDPSTMWTETSRLVNVASSGDAVRVVETKGTVAGDLQNSGGLNQWDATNSQVTVNGDTAGEFSRWVFSLDPAALPDAVEIYYAIKITSGNNFFLMSSDDSLTYTGFFGSNGSGGSPVQFGMDPPSGSVELRVNGAATAAQSADSVYNNVAIGAGVVAGLRNIALRNIVAAGEDIRTSGWSNNGFYFTGALTHIVITAPLTSQERADLEAWLATEVPV